MPRPMVIAYHLMWTAYGWWLPNDPRGSTSHTIASDPITELGELHYGRREVQPSSGALQEFQQRAQEVLKFSVKKSSSREFKVIADGFGEAITEHRYTCYACAIMPDHAHLLIRKHKHQAEPMIANFQHTSRLRLRTARARSPDHPIWGGPGWKVFLDHPDAIHRTIRYIEDNPLKWKLPPQRWPFVTPYDGWPLHPGHDPELKWKLPPQRWPFVTPYDGWPLHPGHDPDSPYARRLRNY